MAPPVAAAAGAAAASPRRAAAKAARGGRTPRAGPARPGPGAGADRERRRTGARGGAPGGAARQRPGRARGADGALTLARAFQLMTQASPSSAPRCHTRRSASGWWRCTAGRTPCSTPARFQRLLRQANDAEIADVRKVGDDEYECRPTGPRPCPRSRAGGAAGEVPRPPAVAGASRRPRRRSPRRTQAGRTDSGSACGSAGARAGRCGPARSRSSAWCRWRPRSRAEPVAAWRSRRAEEAPAEAPAPKKRRAPGPRGRKPRRAGGHGRGCREGDGGRDGLAAQATRPTASQEEGGVSATRRAATLPVSFFERPAEVVARELLGTMVRLHARRRDGPPDGSWRPRPTSGYDDPASHGYRDRRHAQNEALFGPPGTWYVYLSYGMHWCANLVCGPPGHASAVLLRALEPVEGSGSCAAPRRRRRPPALLRARASSARRWASRGSLDGAPMRRSGRHGRRTAMPRAAGRDLTPRIGITKAADWPLRFVLDGSPWASRGRYG